MARRKPSTADWIQIAALGCLIAVMGVLEWRQWQILKTYPVEADNDVVRMEIGALQQAMECRKGSAINIDLPSGGTFTCVDTNYKSGGKK